jgi:pimeloyl-ACP methyl ester carboxylesterase
VRFDRDHYLKIWTLTQPRIESDFLLLDEARDTVGDSAQAVYRWRGAKEVMTGFDSVAMALSRSFRYSPTLAQEANRWLAIASVPYQFGGGVSGIDLYLKRDKVHPVFAGCLPESEANLLGVTQRPAATTAFSEKAKVAAWKDIPSWALVGRQDMTISPEQERFQAKRAGSHTVELDTCHVSLVARPAAVADLILQAARAGETARPTLANTGSVVRTRDAAILGGIAGASLAVGSAAVLLGSRVRRRTR